MNNRITFFTTFSLFLLIPVSFLAQKQTDTLKIGRIEEILLTLKRKQSGIIPHQKLEGTELQNLNSLSVADAVRYFSGVQLKDYGGIGGMKTVNIRGMGSQHVGVFYDGIQLGNAQNGTVDLGKFSLEKMESVSLYNGQKSDIFQSAKDFGSAGTIYLQTKIPKFDSLKKTNLSANFRSGSFGLINSSILYEQKLLPKVSASFNVEHTKADGHYKFRQTVANPSGKIDWDTIGTRNNGDIESIRLEGDLFGKIHNGSWKAKTYYYGSNRGIPGAIVKNVYQRYERMWDKDFFVQASLEKRINPRYRFLVNAKFANDYTRYLNNPPDGETLFIDNTYIQNEFYISTSHEYNLTPNWEVSLSSDYQYNALEADLSVFAFPHRNMELVALASSYKLNRLKLMGSILGTFVQESVENNTYSDPARKREEFTPAFFVSYQPFKEQKLKFNAFYKRIFRMPTLNDLYYTEIGNSLLKPEYTNQYNAGLSYEHDFKNGFLSYLNLVAEAYHNSVTDKIIAYPRGNQFRWTMLNLGKVDIKGVDLSGQAVWVLSSEFLLNSRITYTYEEAIDITDPTDSYYKNQIPYIPLHSGSALMNLVYKKWNFNYSFIYTGERFNMQANIPENYEQPWYTHDLSVSKDFNIEHYHIRASLEVNNLLNQNYSVIKNFPMPGTHYKVALRFGF